MKLTDDVKQRKQRHLKQYRTAKQKLANKENLVRFLHRGKPEDTVYINEMNETFLDFLPLVKLVAKFNQSLSI